MVLGPTVDDQKPDPKRGLNHIADSDRGRHHEPFEMEAVAIAIVGSNWATLCMHHDTTQERNSKDHPEDGLDVKLRNHSPIDNSVMLNVEIFSASK